jgi:acetyltransferase
MTDRCFGPVIMFGHGNGMHEDFNSLSISLPPLNRLLARRLIEKSEIFPLLRSSSHFTSVHFTLLEEMLTRISQLVTDFAEIDTLILNPLYLSRCQAHVAGRRIHVSPASVQAPMHLVISAYPNQYENEVVLQNDDHLLIRPIKPEDALLLSDLFDSLSPQTIYFRFFTPLKSLPHNMLSRFTQIDYDREIALVAIQESKSKEKMLGVSRVIPGRDQKSAEFAILVSDQWQGKGIGAELLKQCLAIAKERNIREVYGIVLAENTTMLALGKKLGFDMKITSEGPEYELRISLKQIHGHEK